MWGGVERDAFDAPHVFDAPPWMLVRLCFMRHATTTHIFGASLHWFLHQNLVRFRENTFFMHSTTSPKCVATTNSKT